MGELIFIGMGLGDERDLTLRAIDELRAADTLFVEQYTSRLAEGSLERLTKLVGKPIGVLTREALEGETAILDPLERGETVALLVTGEPFVATTHLSLRLSAEKRGNTWKVVHNASILTAAASLAGLSLYRFGKVVSIPDPIAEGYRPTSPYEAMLANRNAGLHTLLLLDIDAEKGRFLHANDALRHLGELEEELKGGVAGAETLFCVVARAGHADAAVRAGPRAVLEGMDFGPPLHSVLLPAPSLHFLEQEALMRYRVPTKRSGSLP